MSEDIGKDRVCMWCGARAYLVPGGYEWVVASDAPPCPGHETISGITN